MYLGLGGVPRLKKWNGSPQSQKLWLAASTLILVLAHQIVVFDDMTLRKLFNHFCPKMINSDLVSLTLRVTVRLKGHSESVDQCNDRGMTSLRIPTAFIACLIHLLFIVHSGVLRGVACVVVKSPGSGFILPGSHCILLCCNFLGYNMRVVTKPTS